jgi:PPK2 family polyphosphate:nucleotide phosphotransferase
MMNFQDRFYAGGNESLLIIFQAMDAGGKDGAIKHVMSGMNPQGIDVTNFKQPSAEELAHDYLWRAVKALPRKGKIGIFNRSYYEDVLVSNVHELYKSQNLPPRCKTKDVIKQRYEQIVNFEKYLWENGVRVVKFFLCISKEEQKKRFLSRIDDSAKNWKFSESDLKERGYWDEYMKAYQDAINFTAKEHAAWYVIPSDKKWLARFLISETILKIFEEIDPQYPEFPNEKKDKLFVYKECLLAEKINNKK